MGISNSDSKLPRWATVLLNDGKVNGFKNDRLNLDGL